MRAVVQRVKSASVEVDGSITGKIGAGLLALVAVTHSDTRADVDFVAEKIANLRIFSDAEGKMNVSLLDSGGALLAVSQFTLYGDCRKGRRPSFDAAARPDQARELYDYFVEASRRLGLHVETGIFEADMAVSLINDGPVTLIVESPVRA